MTALTHRIIALAKRRIPPRVIARHLGITLALAIYAWGVLIGCIACGPTFSRLLADIARMTTRQPSRSHCAPGPNPLTTKTVIWLGHLTRSSDRITRPHTPRH